MTFLQKIAFLIVCSTTFLNATLINEHTAAKLAKDAYIEKSAFASKYNTPKNTISTATAYGVRYFIIEDDENTVIAVRGTDNIRNVITDVMATEAPFLGNEKMLVHQGFYKISKSLFKVIKLDIKKPVVVVGHSLGGAVSLLYAAMLKEKNVDVSLYTYGMPPIVNKNFLKKYKDLKHFRHFHIFDPIPTLSKPTITVFKEQLKFKSFQNSKNTINTMIDTIKNIPDKYRHHGVQNIITDKLDIGKEKLKESLFFKTCSLYFDFHKIDNYLSAIVKHTVNTKNTSNTLDVQNTNNYIKVNKPTKKIVKRPKKIEVFPSILKGTLPLEVEFYINPNGNEISYYYFNFRGKEKLLKSLKNNKISHTFKKSGKNKVTIALKDKNDKITTFEFVVTTRVPTFEEYQETMQDDFNKYRKLN